MPDIEEMLIIEPFPDFLIRGNENLHPKKTESKFTL